MSALSIEAITVLLACPRVGASQLCVELRVGVVRWEQKWIWQASTEWVYQFLNPSPSLGPLKPEQCAQCLHPKELRVHGLCPRYPVINIPRIGSIVITYWARIFSLFSRVGQCQLVHSLLASSVLVLFICWSHVRLWPLSQLLLTHSLQELVRSALTWGGGLTELGLR